MLLCEAVQRHQAHAGEALVRETPIVAFADVFELHTAEAHSDPTIKVKELVLDSTEGSGAACGGAAGAAGGCR
jgi:hypothetical protein